MSYEKQAQDYYAKAPLIVLGSGASVPYGMSSMGPLAQHLTNNVIVDDLSNEEQEQWQEFCQKIEDDMGLEQALHEVALSEELTNRIIDATWKLLNDEDLKAFHLYVLGNQEISLHQLLHHMFSSSVVRVNIITTNYDRLAEYACEKGRFHHYTGFTHGFFRQIADPSELSTKRKVNIWKVHGSLDWFKSPLGDSIGLSLLPEIPIGYRPQIVTPGIEKYRSTHLEPYRSIIQSADHAISDASSYLCVGYGFNDEHIQPKLLTKCVRDNTPVILITHTLSDAARDYIIHGGATHYLAIERGSHDNESIIYSSEHDEPIVENKDLWSLNGFMTLVM